MLFDVLHLECLVKETSFSESGITVGCQSERGEIILFYDISKQADAKSNLRKALGMSQNEALCDGIIYYQSGDRRVYCFTELKGNDLERAIEQVSNTYRRFQEILRKNTYQSYCSNTIWKAHIQLGKGSSQIDTKTHDKTLKNIFGQGNFNYIRGNNGDITKFVKGKK